MNKLYFIVQVSLDEFREAVEILEWTSISPVPEGAVQAWRPEGADAVFEWHDGEGMAAPLLVACGDDAQFIASELQSALPLVDAEDAMNAIARASSHEELAVWAERMGLFARGEPDAAVESVIGGLLASGNPHFQQAVLRGLLVARWPRLGARVRELRESGQLDARLQSLAIEVERRLALIGAEGDT